MYEVVTSEQSYLDSLTVAVDHFMHSPDLDIALGPRDRKSLFSSIGKIKEISSLFLEDLKEKLEGNLFCDICDVILHHARNNFSAYVDYIRNMLYQEQTLHNLRQPRPLPRFWPRLLGGQAALCPTEVIQVPDQLVLIAPRVGLIAQSSVVAGTLQHPLAATPSPNRAAVVDSMSHGATEEMRRNPVPGDCLQSARGGIAKSMMAPRGVCIRASGGHGTRLSVTWPLPQMRLVGLIGLPRGGLLQDGSRHSWFSGCAL
ncbi:ARHG5 factor, partial [Polypterus senegalus]